MLVHQVNVELSTIQPARDGGLSNKMCHQQKTIASQLPQYIPIIIHDSCSGLIWIVFSARLAPTPSNKLSQELLRWPEV